MVQPADPPSPPPEVLADTLSSGWSRVYTDVNEFFFDIFFGTDQTGYCSGRKILKSNDGGVNWMKVSDSPRVWNIAAWGSQKAAFLNNAPTSLQTQNGGLTFNSIIANPSLGPGFTDGWYINSDTCIYLSARVIWRSVDGGISADSIHDFSDSPAFGLLFFLPDGRTGWASREYGTFKTTDGGDNWSRVSSRFAFQHYISPTVGFMSKGITIYKSLDGGITFSAIYTHSEGNHLLGSSNDIQFLNENVGFCAIGNHILKTVNGGSTWEVVVRSGGRSIHEIHFTDEDHGWAITAQTILRFAQ